MKDRVLNVADAPVLNITWLRMTPFHNGTLHFEAKRVRLRQSLSSLLQRVRLDGSGGNMAVCSKPQREPS